MKRRARAVVTGLAALGVLAGLVVGLPLALYRFGGAALPRRMPGWHELVRQGAAAQLVALAALAFSVPASVASPAAGTPLVVLDSIVIPDNAATSLTITVHAGDCMWSIAQGDAVPF